MDKIPDELKDLNQWVVWHAVQRGDKTTKVPYQPAGSPPLSASTTNSETWHSFEKVIFYTSHPSMPPGWGLGFVFSPDDPFCGIDLDRCIEEGGNLNEEAQRWVDLFDTYTEISPSGKGVHIIFRGELPEGRGRKTSGIEVYDRSRYFTMTGNAIIYGGKPTDLPNRQEQLDTFLQTYFPNESPPSPTPPPEPADNPIPSRWQDIELTLNPDAQPPYDKMERLLKTNTTFKKTWEHRRSDMKDDSPSAYDMALGRYAYQANWLPQEICNLLIYHRIRHGYDKINRLDYYQRTISTLAKTAQEDAQRDEAQAILELSDALSADDRSAVLEMIRTLTTLDMLRFVQHGRSPACYSLHLANNETVTITVAKEVRDQSVWQDIAQEHNGEAFPRLPAKRWRQFLHCLSLILEYEDIQDGSHLEVLREILHTYARAACTYTSADEAAETVDEAKPFVVDGVLYFSKADLQQWIQLMRVSFSSQGIIGKFRVCGMQKKFMQLRRADGTRTGKNYWIYDIPK